MHLNKTEKEKNHDALDSIKKMLEILDKFEKKLDKEPEKDNVQSLGNTIYSQQRAWLNHIKNNLT